MHRDLPGSKSSSRGLVVSCFLHLSRIIITRRIKAYELDGIRIIRYEESVYYANVDNFKYRIVKAVGIDPKDITNQLAKLEKKTKDKRGVRIIRNSHANRV